MRLIWTAAPPARDIISRQYPMELTRPCGLVMCIYIYIYTFTGLRDGTHSISSGTATAETADSVVTLASVTQLAVSDALVDI